MGFGFDLLRVLVFQNLRFAFPSAKKSLSARTMGAFREGCVLIEEKKPPEGKGSYMRTC